MIKRTYKFQIFPSREQKRLLIEFFGSCRFVYNWALEQRVYWQGPRQLNEPSLTGYGQMKIFTSFRKTVPWLNNTPRVLMDSAIKDLDIAHAKMVRKRMKGDVCRLSFRTKKSYNSVRAPNRDWDVDRSNLNRFRFVGLGWIRFRNTVKWPKLFKLSECVIKLEQGKWYACLAINFEVEQIVQRSELRVGIDRGIANRLTLSTGDFVDVPCSVKERLNVLERRRKHQQKDMMRKLKGSKRREKSRIRVAHTHAKIARIKRHWNHVLSHRISMRFTHVCVEKLNIDRLIRTANRSLSRRIADQNWGQFGQFLTYKVQDSGGSIIAVDPAFTSLTCHRCDNVDKMSRKSQSRFECARCGHSDHADINAAKNILKAGSPPASIRNSEISDLKREVTLQNVVNTRFAGSVI
jgi:putative transposase